jgi:hypothetical protein
MMALATFERAKVVLYPKALKRHGAALPAVVHDVPNKKRGGNFFPPRL